jgi:hypothetical protein
MVGSRRRRARIFGPPQATGGLCRVCWGFGEAKRGEAVCDDCLRDSDGDAQHPGRAAQEGADGERGVQGSDIQEIQTILSKVQPGDQKVVSSRLAGASAMVFRALEHGDSASIERSFQTAKQITVIKFCRLSKRHDSIHSIKPENNLENAQ